MLNRNYESEFTMREIIVKLKDENLIKIKDSKSGYKAQNDHKEK